MHDINEIKEKIHAHLGPKTEPTAESVLVSPKEQAAALIHDMTIMFPSLQSQPAEIKALHIDALKEVLAERFETYFDGLRYTKSALRETLLKMEMIK